MMRSKSEDVIVYSLEVDGKVVAVANVIPKEWRRLAKLFGVRIIYPSSI